MRIKIKYDFYKQLLLPVLLLLGILVFNSHEIAAQYSYYKYLSVEKEKTPKTFVELLFKVKQTPKKDAKNRKSAGAKKKNAKVNSDTTKQKNRIESIRDGGDIFYLYLELEDHDAPIKVTVYNMLGKRVRDVYQGYPKPNGVPYEISIVGPPSLPNGVYLCVVVGKNFRLREKFVVARG